VQIPQARPVALGAPDGSLQALEGRGFSECPLHDPPLFGLQTDPFEGEAEPRVLPVDLLGRWAGGRRLPPASVPTARSPPRGRFEPGNTP